MPLTAPNLDDRRFQDIMDEARTLIPGYCPEWTDHNLSDPGIALVELFAWLTETMLYRLNQVPDRNYVKFLDLMGVKLREPRPARPHAPALEELERHRAFIAQLINPLWARFAAFS